MLYHTKNQATSTKESFIAITRVVSYMAVLRTKKSDFFVKQFTTVKNQKY